jgi:regulator of replication initiation timing
LKDSIEELMEVKNHLMIENRKLIAILKKKELAEKQRKQLLRTEFKEIDRI